MVENDISLGSSYLVRMKIINTFTCNSDVICGHAWTDGRTNHVMHVKVMHTDNTYFIRFKIADIFGF